MKLVKMRKTQWAISIGFLLSCNLHADIQWNLQSNTITITDYPKNAPCTMKTLKKFHDMNGWDKIAFDEKSNTYTVDANLQIGKIAGRESVLKITDANVIMKGNLFVSPYWIQDETPVTDWQQAEPVLNMLEIEGRPDGKNNPVIRFAPEKTLRIGYFPEKKTKLQIGGSLKLYGGTWSALDTCWGSPVIFFGPLSFSEISHSVIEKFDGLIYGFDERNASLSDTVFRDGGQIIFHRYKKVVRNCTFERLTTAVVDYGMLDIVFQNCRFVDNERNFDIAFGGFVTLIDCDVFPGRMSDKLKTSKKTDVKRFPGILSQRHVRIATDSGKPVSILCEQTGKKTSCDSGKRILLTEFMTNLNKKGIPQTLKFTYTISSESESVRNFMPTGKNSLLRLK